MQIKQGFSFILLHIDTQFSNSCKKLSFFPLVFPPLSKNHLTIHLRIYFQVLYCVQQGFPDSSVGKESTCNAGDPCSITGLGRSIQEGIGYPLQYSGLENSMDCTVHGVTKSWTQLSNFHFHFLFTKSTQISVFFLKISQVQDLIILKQLKHNE